MGLAIYTSPDIENKIDSEHPLLFAFDGREGGIQEKCIYLRNDDLDSWYNGITVSAANTEETSSQVWKLLEKDRTTIPEDWEGISDGNTITLSSSIGSATQEDVSTFLPFWVRIEVAPGSSIQKIVSRVIRIGYTRHLI